MKTFKRVDSNIDEKLKSNEPISILSFSVKETASAIKFEFNDGYVNYYDEKLTVKETVSRFKEDHPFYTFICADFMVKVIGNFDGKSYKWRFWERFK